MDNATRRTMRLVEGSGGMLLSHRITGMKRRLS
jgi:hypothetical protein